MPNSVANISHRSAALLTVGRVIMPLDTLCFPACCPVCGMTMRRGIDFCCRACSCQLSRLAHPVCPDCRCFVGGDDPVCPDDHGDLQPRSVAALGVFDQGWRAIVHSLKYDGLTGLAEPLGRGLAYVLPARLLADVVVAVPTDPRKRRARGFGHAELIAESLADHAQIPFISDALRLTRRVLDQTRLTAAQRHANLSGAFAVTDPDGLAGKAVLVVDDVMTTGATMFETARTLLTAGATLVNGAVITVNLGPITDHN